MLGSFDTNDLLSDSNILCETQFLATLLGRLDQFVTKTIIRTPLLIDFGRCEPKVADMAQRLLVLHFGV
jgi:hypothetical protein